ncbi:hypothetical protein TYRP_011857 [Tyrophagus putrescentiae]|nr:hypothetical protein TYRP_011857 [Tyrophagus putrescentiae]
MVLIIGRLRGFLVCVSIDLSVFLALKMPPFRWRATHSFAKDSMLPLKSPPQQQRGQNCPRRLVVQSAAYPELSASEELEGGSA